MDAKARRFSEQFIQRIQAYPPNACPVAMAASLATLAKNQSCGKCVPCRLGLRQAEALLQHLLVGSAAADALRELMDLAAYIRDASDCAIGYTAGAALVESIELFRKDYESHLAEGCCAPGIGQQVPCKALCPAHVDAPGYIALVGEERYADAVALVRRDNPFPTACAYVCEHPCEDQCRRQMIDSAINIRGLKKYACDCAPADQVPLPAGGEETGKQIAIIGAGPSGLTAAYFLALMGHGVTVFERLPQPGGMLRYGIPEYRFPKAKLDEDVRAIQAAGVRIRCGETIDAAAFDQLRAEYDALYLAIGAQKGQGLRLPGVESSGVYSAVDMLREAGLGQLPDYQGKQVVVIGGGNVAMDCARTAIRAKAKSVTLVYRRRQADMTALPVEIQGAMEEGVIMMMQKAPLSIEQDAAGACTSLIAQPQKTGPYDKSGRPGCFDADAEPVRIAADIILIATGQAIDSADFESCGLGTERGRITAPNGGTASLPGVFAGGDCVSGPATVILAVAAGKAAAYAIDQSLGYHHQPACAVSAPPPRVNDRTPIGRVELSEREALLRKNDYLCVEQPMSWEEAMQEANRCLRCDIYGCGVLEGGDVE